MMGHKKRIQGLKKGSVGNSKNALNQYFKPRSSIRNQNKLTGNAHSKTFIEPRNYERIEQNKLPKIGYEEASSKHEGSLEKSQRR